MRTDRHPDVRDVPAHGGPVRTRVLPQYRTLGDLSFAYMQGSLVSGYTDRSDLDVVFVWNGESVPGGTARSRVVAGLDDRHRIPPFVVDYRDVHLERFHLADQEYNVGHRTRRDLVAVVQSVLSGNTDPASAGDVLYPLPSCAGLAYGTVLYDPDASASGLRADLARFPGTLRAETSRRCAARRAQDGPVLRTLAERHDHLAFAKLFATCVEICLIAAFARDAVYYPGSKWVRQSLVRHGLDPAITESYEALWTANLRSRVDALEALMDLVMSP